jgi:TonB family protein
MKPWPKAALFIFFRRHRQQPSLLHGRKQRPKRIHRLFLAAVAEDGCEIRIPTDAVAPPILGIDVEDSCDWGTTMSIHASRTRRIGPCFSTALIVLIASGAVANAQEHPTQEQPKPTQEQPTREQPTQEQPTQEQPTQTQPQLQQAPATATVPTSPKLAPAITSWQQAVVARLARFQRYPAQAKGATGVVNLSFSIDRRGHVLNSRVIKSSGSAVLDTEALSLLARAAPLPPPPAGVPDSDLTFVVPIRFLIR